MNSFLELSLSAIPLIVPFVMLTVLQKTSFQAGLMMLLAVIIESIIAPSFHMDLAGLLFALGKGAFTSFLVLYVIFPSLLLYHLQQSKNTMKALAEGVTYLCPNRHLQVLLLVIGFAPFAGSLSGFGVSIIILVPIFVALGFSLTQAGMLGIIGQMTVPWGALAVGTTLGANLTRLDPNVLGAYTALLVAPLPIIYGLIALLISGGKKAVKRWWLAACAAGGVLSLGLWIFSLVPGIELAGVLASLLVIVLLASWKYLDKGISGSDENQKTRLTEKKLHLWEALTPYIVLTSFLLISRLVTPLRNWLQNNYVFEIPNIHVNFPLLYHPGFSLLLTILVIVPILNIREKDIRVAILKTVRQFLPPAITVICFTTASQFMQVNHMIASLGKLTQILGQSYTWIAPWLGALGGWLTGTNAGSNALFALLQEEASVKSGLPLYWLMGAQNGAASYATMISPHRIILTVTTLGLYNREGYFLTRCTPLVLIAVTIIMLIFAWSIS